MLDKVKLLVVVVLVVAGIVGYYYLSEQPQLYRVLGLVLVIGISLAVALQTQIGFDAWNYSRNAFVEVRKVVWPTRRETVQTTGIVLFMVLIIGLMLWIFDTFLAWAVKQLISQGG